MIATDSSVPDNLTDNPASTTPSGLSPELANDIVERIRGRVPTLSIVIPAYNEEKTIHRLLDRLFAVPLPCRREVIVVDDGSKDNTRLALQTYIDQGLLRYIKQPRNMGKGMALRAGFQIATGDFILVQDADEEYDPRDIPSIVEPLMDGRARVVYGSRVINEHCRGHRRLTNPFWWGGRTLSWIANILFFPICNVSDEAVCYKAFRADVLHTFPLRCTGFEFCPEVTAKVSRRGIPIFNVPIRYSPRSVIAGKKIRARHWFEAVWWLLRFRLSADHGPIADFHRPTPELSMDTGPQEPSPKGHVVPNAELDPLSNLPRNLSQYINPATQRNPQPVA